MDMALILQLLGGVGGAVLTLVVGLIKNKMAGPSRA
jgi:hypothetical protein